MTHWLLIVMLSGNITFSRIYESEAECWKFGQFYTQGIEHDANYACITEEGLMKYIKNL